jgi:hypothetical protein
MWSSRIRFKKYALICSAEIRLGSRPECAKMNGVFRPKNFGGAQETTINFCLFALHFQTTEKNYLVFKGRYRGCPLNCVKFKIPTFEIWYRKKKKV